MLDLFRLGFVEPLRCFGGGGGGGGGGGEDKAGSGTSGTSTSGSASQKGAGQPVGTKTSSGKTSASVSSNDRDDRAQQELAQRQAAEKAAKAAPAPAPALVSTMSSRSAPTTAPAPAPAPVARPALAPVQPTVRPVARPTTVSLPTKDPVTGVKGTTNVSFEEYASLPRDDEGFIDLGSREAQLLDLDVQRPADYGTPEGFALEDALYFGEDSLRSRIEAPPTGLESLFRKTTIGSILGPMADRQQQVMYNQLVQGPNYRGTPVQPTGNFLVDAAGRFIGDRSFDQAASNYVAVTENGRVIGSLAVDAAGNPVGYTGTRSENAQIMDPNVDPAAAASFIEPIGTGTQGDGPMATAVAPPVVDPCPEGYRLDPETQACVLDVGAEAPVQPQPVQPPVQPGPMVPTEVTPMSGYTQLGAMPALQPLMPQPAFAIPRPVMQPVVVPAQTGLASLRR